MTSQFIEKAQKVHGDRYDYSLSVYKNAKEKIIIICKIHGEFKQVARKHVSGQGCRKCCFIKLGNDKRKSLEKFIEDAEAVHGDKFDYSKVVYTTANDKITIICKTHNQEFQQTPQDHLRSNGICSKCFPKVKDIETFIQKAQEVHGKDKYDYSKTVYTKGKEKVIIICKEHGEFLQSADNHTAGYGCLKCGLIEQGLKSRNLIRKTNEQFVEEAIEVHGQKYNYEYVEYTKSYDQVIIECKFHGLFWQIAQDHLNGRGCPLCANKTEGKLLNILKNLYNIKRNFKVDWCKNKLRLPFDFCLPDQKIIIELDGKQHFQKIDFFKNDPEENFKTDKFKEKCANENGYSTIRLLQLDVSNDKYDWLKELQDNIKKIVEENKVQNIYMCKNNEYHRYV